MIIWLLSATVCTYMETHPMGPSQRSLATTSCELRPVFEAYETEKACKDNAAPTYGTSDTFGESVHTTYQCRPFEVKKS